jgi:hypothetical protein
MISLKILLSLLLGIFLNKSTNAQTSISSFKLNKPTDCSSTQYYDISRLICMPCPANSTTSPSDGK